jgi:hypothetical protein
MHKKKLTQFTQAVEKALAEKDFSLPADLKNLVGEVLGEIATIYWRPISPEDVAEILLEIHSREKKHFDLAILHWAMDKEAKGYEVEDLATLSSETSNWGIVAENLLPQKPGWTTVSAVSFVGSEVPFEKILGAAQIMVDAHNADIRIYALPLDYEKQNGTFRQQFGEEGVLIYNLHDQTAKEMLRMREDLPCPP